MNVASAANRNVDEVVILALADHWCCSPQDVSARIATAGGDIVMSAKEVMSVGAIIEELLGNVQIFSPNDFATDATRVTASPGRTPISINGCMDPAEACSIRKIIDITKKKLGVSG